jgi:uncharacterized protein (DUF2384 family)
MELNLFMLHCAMSRRQSVDEFIYGLGLKEANADKRRKTSALVLSEEEWTRVCLFCNILRHANDAQQAFSASSMPTLQHALPALEKLYSSWEKATAKP